MFSPAKVLCYTVLAILHANWWQFKKNRDHKKYLNKVKIVKSCYSDGTVWKKNLAVKTLANLANW